MSMEAYALCDREIDSIEQWQRTIDELQCNLQLQSQGGISGRQGHLPATWHGLEAGFEFRPFPFLELKKTYTEINFRKRWLYSYAFYFHTLAGCVGTWFALAACTRLTGGMAYDPQEGLLLSADEALQYARDTEKNFYELSEKT